MYAPPCRNTTVPWSSFSRANQVVGTPPRVVSWTSMPRATFLGGRVDRWPATSSRSSSGRGRCGRGAGDEQPGERWPGRVWQEEDALPADLDQRLVGEGPAGRRDPASGDSWV